VPAVPRTINWKQIATGQLKEQTSITSAASDLSFVPVSPAGLGEPGLVETTTVGDPSLDGLFARYNVSGGYIWVYATPQRDTRGFAYVDRERVLDLQDD
jgi:hypothetical protein